MVREPVRAVVRDEDIETAATRCGEAHGVFFVQVTSFVALGLRQICRARNAADAHTCIAVSNRRDSSRSQPENQAVVRNGVERFVGAGPLVAAAQKLEVFVIAGMISAVDHYVLPGR